MLTDAQLFKSVREMTFTAIVVAVIWATVSIGLQLNMQNFLVEMTRPRHEPPPMYIPTPEPRRSSR